MKKVEVRLIGSWVEYFSLSFFLKKCTQKFAGSKKRRTFATL